MGQIYPYQEIIDAPYDQDVVIRASLCVSRPGA
jgi:hypothetical protein